MPQVSTRIVRTAVIATFGIGVPATAFGQMEISTYQDGAGYYYNGQLYIEGISSVEDTTVGCSHTNYYTTTTISNPDWSRSSSNQSSGLGSSASLTASGESGYWSIETAGYLNCDCGTTVEFGPFYDSLPVALFAARYKRTATTCTGGWRYDADCSHPCMDEWRCQGAHDKEYAVYAGFKIGVCVHLVPTLEYTDQRDPPFPDTYCSYVAPFAP